MLAIFLDQETTGLDVGKHHVIEIAFKVFDLTAGKQIAAYDEIVNPSKIIWSLADPKSLEINGFTWEKVKQGKSPQLVGEEVIELLTSLNVRRNHAVFICQNPAFDRAFFAQLVNVYTHEKLEWPYHWLDLASMYWMHRTQDAREKNEPFPETLSLSKDSIAKNQSLPPEDKPHRAMNGVDHLILCYDAVVGLNRKAPL